MKRPALLLTIAFAAACGGDSDNPFDKLTLDGEFTVGLDDPVHVARDVYGVAHIHGKSLRDVAFVQGYVMAHDRLPQLDVLRRFGAGTLGELYGAVDASVLNTDLEMRMHRMKPLATATFEILKASTDAVDRDVVSLLERFSDGVNAYATDVKNKKWNLDPNFTISFSADNFEPWSPVDSLVLGRFQAFALSFTAPFEIEMSKLFDDLQKKFPIQTPRGGVPADILTLKPLGLAPTIDGFPNVGQDRETTSDGFPAPAPRVAAGGAAVVPSSRPRVSDATYAAALSAFSQTVRSGPNGALGPHAFMQPHAGSNNWAVGPELTGGEFAILATDQHLQLPNPSIFYPTHLIVDDGDDDEREPNELDVIGVTFPGIPGVILGSNGRLAWSGTVSNHDVNDVYLETLTPCAGAPTGAEPRCVLFNKQAIPIETRDEEIRVGFLGQITSTITATYEYIPHHGPVPVNVDRAAHKLIPRPSGQQPLSIRYTGYEPTFEIRALTKLVRANNVTEGFQALADFSYGSQNWTMVDQDMKIGWTANAVVPNRPPAAYQWNARTRPEAAAPFLILDGRGDYEWEGRMSTRYVPHAISPVSTSTGAPQPFLATANADPVGATFDNDPLNQPSVDGRPLYVGVAYAAGVRQERIVDGIKSGGDRITGEAMERLQHDSLSTVGAKMTPLALVSLALLSSTNGQPADAQAYANSLPQGNADRVLLERARALLAGWTFATPIADDGAGSSAATALFNTWMHFFLEGALNDELAPGADAWSLDDNLLARIAYQLLAPDTVLSKGGPANQPILCGRFGATPDNGSCSKLVLETMLAAMKHLESPAGYGTADTAQWLWGNKHRLTIEPLVPNPELNLPRPDELALPGFPKAGDNFNVNRADAGWRDLGFAQSADGPAQRFVAEARPGQPIKVRWQIPGGVIFDSRSPHYRDLLDKYYLPQVHFDAPFVIDDIVKNGETRWEFR